MPATPLRTDTTAAGLAPDLLVALLDASRSINDELDPDERLQRVATQAAAVLQVEGASVLLLDTVRDQLVFHTVVDPASGAVLVGQRMPADAGVAGQVIRTRRPVRLDDPKKNRNFYPGIDALTATRTRNLIAVPLIHRDEVLGVLEVVNTCGRDAFQDHDVELLTVFANLVAGAARGALALDRVQRENEGLRASMPEAQFIGRSPAFQNVMKLCGKVAEATTTVLLTGETGTGKEMAARALHAMSNRASGPFVAVNCAALPESLIESELFGHEAGAFTGATARRIGNFELADHGTLLLDEIGELDLSLQAKLLRVLESSEFTRVGGREIVACDVRVIAATNRDLRSEIDAGRFREDLFYRLNVFPIDLPPLRDRGDDLELLVEHLVARVAPSLRANAVTVTPEAMACLRRYAWPGNIRELRNVIERAVLLADDAIRGEHLPPEIAGAPVVHLPDHPGDILADQERKTIQDALIKHDWNQSAAARALGVSRDILRSRIKRYGLRRS